MIAVAIEKNLKVYRGKHVLKINHQFKTGSITRIYGPSGAGKTTLLKIIAGLIDPEKGTIRVNNVPWLDTGANISLSPQKRMPGFVFQDYALFPNMTVLQHLEYATNNRDWINRLLLLGQLDTLADHKPIHLSGGQQQRLAILRALAIKPRLLLIDEPFSALDPAMKAELITGLKPLFAELQATVLIVSHNPVELEGLADGELYIQPL
ncbi:ATP-binding cassette domain-containing protein [Mucilaginibacter sp. UR6-11]|uniref:ATP-binding cassette domain-containing protein n=1 Tax=Mucilaginibacter sp. UR6-11 TaxID=1435644 RepID=UPI001E5D5316|nr:ATP-binding cassette domain-containing protein [Mucilaginibacter sp. UR6-11]MCC8424447.1 ATP-binding cassette domain-containing protein [Mucilaginibacter sp. UR6-11]